MIFKEAKLDETIPVVQALRNADSIAQKSSYTPEIIIPVMIPEGRIFRCVSVSLGEEGHPIHISAELSESLSNISIVGRISVDSLFIENGVDLDSEHKVMEKPREFIGQWGGFLKASVIIDYSDLGAEPREEAEFAIMESQDELDKFGDTSGKEVFETRPAQLTAD